MTRVVVLDYGSGNLRSAERALERAGADVSVTSDYDTARRGRRPGRARASARSRPACAGIDAVARRRRSSGTGCAAARPVLGICVGMQVLFENGVEHGEQTAGLGVLPGAVTRLQADVVPHMGWNTVERARRARRCSTGSRTSASTSCTPTPPTTAPDALTTTQRARRALRRRGRARTAVGHAVPPGEERRRRRRPAAQLDRDPVSTTEEPT